MGRLIKKPVSQFVDKSWTEISKELVEYLRKWAYTYPKGYEDITELLRSKAEIKVSNSQIFDNLGIINSLYVYIDGYSPGPIVFNIDSSNLRDIAKMIEDEKEKA